MVSMPRSTEGCNWRAKGIAGVGSDVSCRLLLPFPHLSPSNVTKLSGIEAQEIKSNTAIRGQLGRKCAFHSKLHSSSGSLVAPRGTADGGRTPGGGVVGRDMAWEADFTLGQ